VVRRRGPRSYFAQIRIPSRPFSCPQMAHNSRTSGMTCGANDPLAEKFDSYSVTWVTARGVMPA
jgi:hypothetical protein